MFHILTQFSGAVTYNMFITLGLITSVPVSACKQNITVYFLNVSLTQHFAFLLAALDILLYGE
jgi:hypothetical protein